MAANVPGTAGDAGTQGGDGARDRLLAGQQHSDRVAAPDPAGFRAFSGRYRTKYGAESVRTAFYWRDIQPSSPADAERYARGLNIEDRDKTGQRAPLGALPLRLWRAIRRRG